MATVTAAYARAVHDRGLGRGSANLLLLTVKELSSETFGSLHIDEYGLHDLVHLNDLLERLLFLALLHKSHHRVAVMQEVSLSLRLQLFHLTQLLVLQFHKSHLLLDI